MFFYIAVLWTPIASGLHRCPGSVSNRTGRPEHPGPACLRMQRTHLRIDRPATGRSLLDQSPISFLFWPL